MLDGALAAAVRGWSVVPVRVDPAGGGVEALVDVEPSELFKLLDLVVRLSNRTQIVLLTSDATIAKWARREASHGIVTLLETDGAAVR